MVERAAERAGSRRRGCRRWKTVVCAGLAGFTSLVAILSGGAWAQPGQRETIVIGSKNFTENRLLGEIMAQLLEAETDLVVERRTNLGGTTVVFTALTSGQIDIYPEYTGTGWSIHLGRTDRVADPLRAYLVVAEAFARRYDITWLSPFGFSNSYALAVSDETANRLDLRRISDLREHQEALVAGVSHEFLNRQDGYPGLAAAYGLRLPNLKGMEHGLAYEAIRSGRIDLIDTWTTDGKLLRYDITILEDDEKFFPPYDAAPIVRGETLRRHPEIRAVLSKLAFRIDDQKMRTLNFQVEEQGGPFDRVARDFLRAEGLIDAGAGGKGRGASADGSTRDGFWAFMKSRLPRTLDLTLTHLWLTGIAVALAIALAVPLGILLTLWPPLVPPVLGGAGVIQTIPSLALLAFMIPIPLLGLGSRSAIAALFLYALLPIVRNTYTGIKGVDPDLLEAAQGMGLRRHQILLFLQLPLATRTIMAGIRTSTVISIGVATLAAFVGAGGLGDPIVTGLQLNDMNLILSGAIPAALLALVVDFILGRVETALVPRGIR